MGEFNPRPKPTPRPKKAQKPIRKRTAKKNAEIVESDKYFDERVQENRDRNDGVVLCEECGCPIHNPIGRNWCHTISSGSNKKLYLNPDNGFMLCFDFDHVWMEEDGRVSQMKIYPKWKEKRTMLLQTLIPPSRRNDL